MMPIVNLLIEMIQILNINFEGKTALKLIIQKTRSRNFYYDGMSDVSAWLLQSFFHLKVFSLKIRNKKHKTMKGPFWNSSYVLVYERYRSATVFLVWFKAVVILNFELSIRYCTRDI